MSIQLRLVTAGLLGFATLSALADQVSAESVVPAGVYVTSNHPQCGTESPLADTLKRKEFQKTVGSLFGKKAEAAVVFTSQANNIALKSGGDLARWVRGATGQNDFSSCALVCARLPAGATLSYINLSRRNGNIGTWLGAYEVPIVDSLDTSGWRDVTFFKDEDSRDVVCATATNWSADQASKKILRAYFNEEKEIPNCGGYTKIEGQTWVPPGNDRWTTTWDLRNRTLEGRHPTGAVVTGSVQGICLPTRIIFTTQQSDNNVCSCTLSRQSAADVSLSGNCTCPGAGVRVEAQLKR